MTKKPVPARRATRLAVVCLIAATVTAFLPTLANGLTNWDDPLNLTRNPHLRPLSWSGLLELWRAPYAELYVPLTYTSFAADAFLWNWRPVGFHVTNLLLHTTSVLVVFLLLRRITSGPTAAAIGAAVFAIHPAMAEPVAWVTGRKDVLSGMLALLSLYAYVRWRESGGRGWHAWTICALLGALLAKPSAVVVPVMALAFDRWLLGSSWRRAVKGTAALFALAVAWAGLAMLIHVGGDAAIPEIGVADRAVVASDSLLYYVRHVLLPVHLAPVQGRTPSLVLASRLSTVLPLVVAGLGVVFACAGRRAKGAGVLFVGGLLPILGLVPFTYQQWSTVADRYLYLAMLGVAVAVAWLCEAALRCRSGRVAVAVVLIALGGQTWVQGQVWRDSLRLWRCAQPVAPELAVVDRNLGTAYATVQLHRLALPSFSRALEKRGLDAQGAYNMAGVLFSLGDHKRAVELARYAVRLDPGDPIGHVNLGNALKQLGHLKEAEAAFREAVALAPYFAEAHAGLAEVLTKTGRGREALGHFDAALKIAPEFFPALVNAGRLLAMSPDDALRDGPRAVALAERAVRLRPDDARALSVLAAAYAETGDFISALRALSFAERRAGEGELSKGCAAMRAAFERRRPFRTAR